MSVFFSDQNVQHLRNKITSEVQRLKGITLQPAQVEEVITYMLHEYRNYLYYNGSICFVNLQKDKDLKQTIGELNTATLQNYLSLLLSELDMYTYFYKDISTQPKQLAVPIYTSMKGSRVLQPNIGFTPGNSLGVASFNEADNIIDKSKYI